MELDFEGCGSIQGRIDFCLVLDRSRDFTLLVTVEDRCQLVWKSSRLALMASFFLLFVFSHIGSKGIS